MSFEVSQSYTLYVMFPGNHTPALRPYLFAMGLGPQSDYKTKDANYPRFMPTTGKRKKSAKQIIQKNRNKQVRRRGRHKKQNDHVRRGRHKSTLSCMTSFSNLEVTF